MSRYQDFNDTVPTDHAPLEGEPRRPLYPRMERMSRSPGNRLIVALALVALCATLVLLPMGLVQ